MACVKSDGTISASAISILKALHGVTLSPGEIAQETGLPFFRVRSSLRELEESGLVIQVSADAYTISPLGEACLQEQEGATHEEGGAGSEPRGPDSGPILPGEDMT